jgi:deoxyribose-phosphate aldolase
LNRAEFGGLFDHSILKPNAQPQDIIFGCELAKKLDLGLVMIQPCYVELAKKQLIETKILVGTVLSFPHGCDLPEVKAFSAKCLYDRGANDLDMVLNIGALKAKKYDFVEQDIKGVVQAAPSAVIKVILETSFLTQDEIVIACQLCQNAGAHFVKTSTGFSDKGATPEDISLMRKTVGKGMGVKAAGGIRTLDQALAMVRAGANRIGVSASLAIMQGWDEQFGDKELSI